MITKPFKHSDAEIAFLKRYIPDLIQMGQPVNTAIKGLGVSTRMLIRWRRDDVTFDRAILAALKAKREGNTAVATARKGEAGTRLLQERLIEHIDAGEKPARAAENIGVSYRTVLGWCDRDPAFKEMFDKAVRALTHMELDRLADLHEEIPDAKVALVASKNVTSWIEKRNRQEFGQKAEASNDSQPQLLSILQAAVQRLIDQVPVPAPQSVIDVTPEERKQLSHDDPQDKHRP